MTNNYLVWKCLKCKKYQSNVTKQRDIKKITLKCKRCGASLKLKKERELGLSTECARYESGYDAAKAVADLNAELI